MQQHFHTICYSKKVGEKKLALELDFTNNWDSIFSMSPSGRIQFELFKRNILTGRYLSLIWANANCNSNKYNLQWRQIQCELFTWLILTGGHLSLIWANEHLSTPPAGLLILLPQRRHHTWWWEWWGWEWWGLGWWGWWGWCWAWWT